MSKRDTHNATPNITNATSELMSMAQNIFIAGV